MSSARETATVSVPSQDMSKECSGYAGRGRDRPTIAERLAGELRCPRHGAPVSRPPTLDMVLALGALAIPETLGPREVAPIIARAINGGLQDGVPVT